MNINTIIADNVNHAFPMKMKKKASYTSIPSVVAQK